MQNTQPTTKYDMNKEKFLTPNSKSFGNAPGGPLEESPQAKAPVQEQKTVEVANKVFANKEVSKFS